MTHKESRMARQYTKWKTEPIWLKCDNILIFPSQSAGPDHVWDKGWTESLCGASQFFFNFIRLSPTKVTVDMENIIPLILFDSVTEQRSSFRYRLVQQYSATGHVSCCRSQSSSGWRPMESDWGRFLMDRQTEACSLNWYIYIFILYVCLFSTCDTDLILS